MKAVNQLGLASEEAKFRKSVRNALIASAAVAATFSGGTYAQTTPAPPEGESQELETIEVTGSRIPRPQLESASPVTVIEREEILATGITDVGDLLQRLPSMSGSPIGTTTNNGGDGSVQIDLRGMGVDRTLTLINGRRLVDGGDYQTIPASMIERVEILKDGGSTVYGADAVAGVVNIITRKDFTGAEFNVQNNDWFNTDGAGQTSYNMVTGKSFSGGHFVFGAEYVDQTQAYQSDTPWDFFQNSYYIYPEGCENQVTQPYPVGCYPIGSSRIIESRLRFARVADGGTGQGIFMNPDGTGLVPYDGRTYNYAPVNYIQTPYQRTNLFMTGDFELNEYVNFATEIRGNFRQSAQELAPTPYNSPTDPAYFGTFNGVSYRGISEDNYYLVQAATAAGLTPEPVTDARRRMHEQPRRFTQDVTQMQGAFSLNGELAEVSWDLSYNRGYRSQISRDFGQYAGSRMFNALGPSADLLDAAGNPGTDGVPECYRDLGDPSTIIAGCVPLNLFGGPNSVTPEMYDYINANLVDTLKVDLDEAYLVLDGHALQLPGGQLGWAAGFQYLGQKAEFTPDSNKALGEVTGNVGEGTKGALYSNAFMGEVFAPVFDNGEQSLALSGGLRFDDYSRFGSETTWKLGVEVNALQELKLRGTAATVFRQPTIGDLFGGQSDSFPTYTDPCNVPDVSALPGCAQPAPAPTDSQVLSRVGGNPDTKPENGDTLTFGLVFEPKLGFGTFSATLDYWDIQIENGISSLGVQNILDSCAETGSPTTCNLVQRNPTDYSVDRVIDTTLNVTEQGAKGIDTELRFGFSPGVGRLDTALLWTHLLERTKVPFPGAGTNDLSGRYTDPTAQDGGAYASDKMNYSFRWSLPNVGPGNLAVSYLGEYISALDADTFCNCDSDGDPSNNLPDGRYIQKIDAVLYHDLVAELELPFGLKLMGGITNVTDEEPPFIEVGFNASTDPSTYRMLGQGYFLRAAMEFR